MKHKKEVEFVKNVLEIPNDVYDLLLDSMVDKLIGKYIKALDKSLDMYFRKGTYLFPNKEALKEYLLKESEKE